MYTTSASLLERLGQPDPEPAWARFVELYMPLLLYWARQAGLQPQDAADLVQEVFVVLVQKLPAFSYDQRRNFRGWLRTIALNKWRDFRRRGRVRAASGHGLPEVADEHALEAFWEAEHRQRLVARALEVMQAEFEPTTWKACWEFAVESRPAAAVAGELGISENAVYIAKCRVLRRLRQELDGLLE